MKNVKPQTRNGFTLIELLVVISIIGILMALLLPVIQTARELARSMICKTNLRSFYVACNNLQSKMGESATVGLPSRWVGALSPYMEDVSAMHICPNDIRDVSDSGGGGQSIEGPITLQAEMPPSLEFGRVESNSTAFLYVEKSDFVLPAHVSVDTDSPGYYATRGDFSGGMVPAGNRVDVYYLHYDPVGNQNSVIENGRINFSAKILGVICQTGSLDSTDGALGNSGTLYPNGKVGRGFESGAERIELSGDMRSFILHRFHATFGENVRIITGPGGAPSSYGMNNQFAGSPLGLACQVFITDYEKSVIDLDMKHNSDFQWDSQTKRYHNPYLELRHFGGVNVLYWNGNIKTESGSDFFNPLQQHWKGLEK